MEPTTYNTGKHTWTHFDPCYTRGKDWQGRAINQYLGPCPKCGTITFDYGGGWACCKDSCQHSVSNIVCNNGPRPDWWNTGVNVRMDGNAWCATGPGFINLQESNAGFGDSPRAAVAALLAQHQGGV